MLVGQIHERGRRLVHNQIVPGLRYSDHFGGGTFRAVQPDSLSDGILARPIGLRKLLVHDRDAARSGAIVIRERAPALYFDVHGGEVSGIHGGAELYRCVAALRELVALGHNSDHGLRGRERQRLGHRHLRHARHRANAIDKSAVESHHLFGRIVQHGGRGVKADQVVRAKLRRHHQHVPEASEKHTGGDQNHHRERDLSGHQNIAAECAELSGRALLAGLQCAHEVRPRGLPGRNQAEEDTTPERSEQAELDNAPIQLYAQHIRWIARHAERLEQQNAAVCD